MAGIISKITCPTCWADIEIDVTRLLAGEKMACASCGTVVSLAPAGEAEVRAAFDTFENLHRHLESAQPAAEGGE